MTPNEREARIQKHIDLLGCSYAEAEQIVLDDEIIDKGGRCDWEPSIEEERAMRKATKLVGERKRTGEPVKRERKENTPKRELIAMMAEALANAGITADVTNVERLIAFEYEGAKFELTLTQKRK